MKLRLAGLLSVATLSLVGTAFSVSAKAQSAGPFNGPISGSEGQYALLNGEFLSLYVDARGDLGAPRKPLSSGLAKPGPALDANGRPFNNGQNINADGSVKSSVNDTFGALFSPNSTAALSLHDSVSAKSEYITGTPNGAAEGFAIKLGDGAWTSYRNLNFVDFGVGGNSVTGLLTATTHYTLGNLPITQDIAFNDAANKNRAKFTITFDNSNGTAPVSVQYARVVNPNQGAPGTIQTTVNYGTPIFTNAFAIDSVANGKHLGIGVLPGTDPNAAGSVILSNDVTDEGGLLNSGNLDTFLDNYPFVQLRSDLGADYINPDPSQNESTLGPNDFNSLQNVQFATGTEDTSLLLYSPNITVGAGQIGTYTFYYFFDTINQGPPTVPEPGAVALLLAGVVGCSALLRRRNRK
jgi:hypothetical protein